jgi:hypothetical protein
MLAGSAIPRASADMLEHSQFPSLISAVRVNSPLDFCGEPVELENFEVRERLEKELLLTLWDRAQTVLWFKRASRYLPLIEEMLAKNDMPSDLKFVPIVESALRPHAGSRKGAIGFWQFMVATGRKYGLKINHWIDERRNIFRSTTAAIIYLKELYNIFGSWTLAAAAYNMGEHGLQSEILTQKTHNYYALYLPLETQRHIFRILSAKLIFADPEKYGFRLHPEDLYPPLQFDRMTISGSQETPIHIIAQAANTSFKVIKDLNPEIRGHYLAVGRHTILIPQGAANGFQQRYRMLLVEWLAENQEQVYVVKAGDTLTGIAERFNVPLPALLIWNRLDHRKPIHPGDRLVIYSNAIEPEKNLSK